MIIARSPLRITLGGGGTDLPSYYEKFGGWVLSAAIDKYVYVAVHSIFPDEVIVKYSQMERVSRADELKHPILREALLLHGVTERVEISSFADIPAGTGLGSSGSFTVSLLHALHHLHGNMPTRETLAEEACDIEINRLREPIGKQDQFAASFGGVRAYRFAANKPVEVISNPLSKAHLNTLEDSLVLAFTGYSRSASDLLREQHTRSLELDPEMIANLHMVRELGGASLEALQKGDIGEFGRLMDLHWKNKRKRSKSMSHERIDSWYDLALANGALGGKLVGAGGGGFLLFATLDRPRLVRALETAGLSCVRFRFDVEGTRILF
jgi:D-glycero-alpha-D-manno-heptose-7-phosphate kinase